MPLVVQHAADVVQKHTIEVKLFAVGIHGENVGFALPIETQQHWYLNEPLTRDVCNQVINKVTGPVEGANSAALNDQMTVFEVIDESEAAEISEKAWKLFSPQTDCNDVKLTISQTMKAKNGKSEEIIMGNLSYLDTHGKIPTETSLNIWFFQGLGISCVLLPGGLGMSYNKMPADIPNQKSNSKISLIQKTVL